MNIIYLTLCIIFSIVILYITISFFYGYKGIFKNVDMANMANIDNYIKHKKIVVSLTTLPSRISNIEKVINSILVNTIKPDIIYLNVPQFSTREQKSYDIPQSLLNIETLKINIIDTDYGPVTKLYPTLFKELDPETIIICIDDDKEYDHKLI
jgi:hypothetical protein